MWKTINTVTIGGNLVRDMEIRHTANGYAVGSFTVAVNYSKKVSDHKYEDEAHFFDVSLFGKYAEVLASSMKKGTQVVVQGAIKQDRWEKNGIKNSKVSIAASTVMINSSSQGGGGQYQQPAEPSYSPAMAAVDMSEMPKQEDFDDENLPF